MEKRTFALLAALALSMMLWAGCSVPSIHPLCSGGDTVDYPHVVGVWVYEQSTSGETWKFFKKPNVSAYTMIYINQGRPARFEARFTRIGDTLYMDTWPVLDEENQGLADRKKPVAGNMLARMHLVPVHLFWRVEAQGNTLRIAMLDADKLKEQLGSGTVTVAHEYQEIPGENEPLLILTASTSELREFLLKVGDKVFAEPVELRRKPAKQ